LVVCVQAQDQEQEEEIDVLLGTLGGQAKGQESREASLAAAQNKHGADAACSRMCAQGQARPGQQQSPTPPLPKAKATHTCSITVRIINNQDLDRASRFRQQPPPAIKAHQPSSAQCIFAAQAHPDTQLLLQKPAIYQRIAAAKQSTAVPNSWRQRPEI
jgi:hypothetical protein